MRLVLSSAADWEASISTNEVTVQPGELFDISLKVKNLSNHPVVARIRHLIEPQNLTDFLDFVECGFLLPVTLEPGREQDYAARYLLRGNLPEGVRVLNLTYDFRRLLK
jgi:cytochrome c oxidase assembly protein Cox11